jgi:sodium-dependent phosphate transporter
MEDWTMRWYHIFLGPSLWFRGPVPPIPEGVKVQIVQDYYRGHVTKDDIIAQASLDEQYQAALSDVEKIGTSTDQLQGGNAVATTPDLVNGENADRREPSYSSPMSFWMFIKRTVLRGLFVPVVEEQSRTTGSKLEKYLAQNIKDVHARAHKYDNKTEYLYSMLQAFTATTASFAHGYASFPILLTLTDRMTSLTQWVLSL